MMCCWLRAPSCLALEVLPELKTAHTASPMTRLAMLHVSKHSKIQSSFLELVDCMMMIASSCEVRTCTRRKERAIIFAGASVVQMILIFIKTWKVVIKTWKVVTCQARPLKTMSPLVVISVVTSKLFTIPIFREVKTQEEITDTTLVPSVEPKYLKRVARPRKR